MTKITIRLIRKPRARIPRIFIQNNKLFSKWRKLKVDVISNKSWHLTPQLFCIQTKTNAPLLIQDNFYHHQRFCSEYIQWYSSNPFHISENVRPVWAVLAVNEQRCFIVGNAYVVYLIHCIHQNWTSLSDCCIHKVSQIFQKLFFPVQILLKHHANKFATFMLCFCSPYSKLFSQSLSAFSAEITVCFLLGLFFVTWLAAVLFMLFACCHPHCPSSFPAWKFWPALKTWS